MKKFIKNSIQFARHPVTGIKSLRKKLAVKIMKEFYKRYPKQCEAYVDERLRKSPLPENEAPSGI